jgi:hypothetical protein
VWRHFGHIKAKYPHCFHGRSLDGMPVYYEKPAVVDLEALSGVGVGLEELLRHNIAVFEFMWQHVAPSETMRYEDAQCVTVIDVTGMNFTSLSGDVLTFLKQVAHYRERHYPKRAAKIFIVNVQSWFHHIWTLVSQFLDPGTLLKVEFVADEKEIPEKLSKCIALDQVGSTVLLIDCTH